MLRFIGKVLATVAVSAVSTYLGKKFLDWAGKKPEIEAKKDDV